MKAGSRFRRIVVAVALVVAVVSALASAGSSAASASTNTSPTPVNAPAPYQPGDLVWTTSDSVPPPSASMPLLTALAPPVTVTPVVPYQPGDKVYTSTSQVPAPALPDANGCQRVPSSGYIGSGVYASTSYEYSNYWSWSASSSGEPFHWYIRRLSDDKIMYDGYSSGGGGDQYTTATSWRWQVQNQGTDPQAWNVCYQTL